MERPRSTSRQELAEAYTAIVGETPAKPVGPSVPAPAPIQVPEGAKRQQLADAYDNLIEYEASKPKTQAAMDAGALRLKIQVAVAAACFSTAGYLTIMKPAWLYPRPAAPQPITTEAQAKRSLVISAALVNAFRTRTGQLPRDLTTLGLPVTGVSLVDFGNGRYRLVAVGPAVPVTADVGAKDSVVITAVRP